MCGAKGITDLLIRKLGEVSADPLGMLPRDVAEAPEIDVILYMAMETAEFLLNWLLSFCSSETSNPTSELPNITTRQEPWRASADQSGVI